MGRGRTESSLVNGELDGTDSSASTKVVLEEGEGESKESVSTEVSRGSIESTHHSSLESLLPSVEVHRSKLSHGRT